jgi:hypothetical protein
LPEKRIGTRAVKMRGTLFNVNPRRMANEHRPFSFHFECDDYLPVCTVRQYDFYTLEFHKHLQHSYIIGWLRMYSIRLRESCTERRHWFSTACPTLFLFSYSILFAFSPLLLFHCLQFFFFCFFFQLYLIFGNLFRLIG